MASFPLSFARQMITLAMGTEFCRDQYLFHLCLLVYFVSCRENSKAETFMKKSLNTRSDPLFSNSIPQDHNTNNMLANKTSALFSSPLLPRSCPWPPSRLPPLLVRPISSSNSRSGPRSASSSRQK